MFDPKHLISFSKDLYNHPSLGYYRDSLFYPPNQDFMWGLVAYLKSILVYDPDDIPTVDDAIKGLGDMLGTWSFNKHDVWISDSTVASEGLLTLTFCDVECFSTANYPLLGIEFDSSIPAVRNHTMESLFCHRPQVTLPSFELPTFIAAWGFSSEGTHASFVMADCLSEDSETTFDVIRIPIDRIPGNLLVPELLSYVWAYHLNWYYDLGPEDTFRVLKSSEFFTLNNPSQYVYSDSVLPISRLGVMDFDNLGPHSFETDSTYLSKTLPVLLHYVRS